MKKFGMILAGVLVLLLAVIVVVPLVVNVDKYRPQIVEAANQQMNGKLELGKLSLSLWGQIRIEVAGLKLTDAKGQEVLGVKDAYFHLPFLSVFSGSPTLNFKMRQPLVNVVKSKGGKLNLLGLMKEKESGKSQGTSSPSTAPSSPSAGGPGGGTPSLPAALVNARLGLELENAQLSYKDEGTGLISHVKDLNVRLKDVSLSRPTELEVWADLDTQMGKTFSMKGPMVLSGKAQPTFQNGKVENVSVSMKLDLSDLAISSGEVFDKKKGVPIQMELALSASEQDAKIENFSVKFFNAEIKGQGTVTHLGGAPGSSPVVSLNLKSNEIQFKPWADLVPMLKEYELGGAARFETDLSGPADKMGYRAQLTVDGLTAKAPKLKAQPRIDAKIHVITDQMDQFSMSMKAPGNDLKIQGKVISFSHPKADFQVTSSGMDLDQLIEFPPPAPVAKAGAPAPGGAPTGGKSAAPTVDMDALLDPLRQNKALMGFVMNLGIDMKLLKAKNVKITDIQCKMSFKDLTAGLDACGLKVFSGAIKAGAQVQLKPKTPVYQFNTQVDGLNLAQAVESQMAMFKNTVTGSAHFNMTGQGSSFNPESATSNLKAKGNLKVDQAVFATVDVMKMVSEALNKALGQIGDKVPAAKGKTVGNLQGQGSKYEFISSDFTIADGKFNAPNFYAKALPNQGIDLKGTTTVGLKDNSLNAAWDVIDTYNLTKARDISVEQSGVRVDHILAEGNSPVHFLVHANCTTLAPCYNYSEVPGFLVKVAMNNVGQAVEGKAKEELKKRAESAIQQAAPQLQKQLKGLFR